MHEKVHKSNLYLANKAHWSSDNWAIAYIQFKRLSLAIMRRRCCTIWCRCYHEIGRKSCRFYICPTKLANPLKRRNTQAFSGAHQIEQQNRVAVYRFVNCGVVGMCQFCCLKKSRWVAEKGSARHYLSHNLPNSSAFQRFLLRFSTIECHPNQEILRRKYTLYLLLRIVILLLFGVWEVCSMKISMQTLQRATTLELGRR